MSLEAIEGEAKLDAEANKDEVRPAYTVNNISVDIYYAFLNCRPLSGNDYKLTRSIVQRTSLGASVATVLAYS